MSFGNFQFEKSHSFKIQKKVVIPESSPEFDSKNEEEIGYNNLNKAYQLLSNKQTPLPENIRTELVNFQDSDEEDEKMKIDLWMQINGDTEKSVMKDVKDKQPGPMPQK